MIDGVNISNEKIYQVLVETRDEVRDLRHQIPIITDHEARLRRVEKWTQAWKPLAIVSMVSMTVNVLELFHVK